VNCEARCEKEVDGCKLFQPLPVGVPSSQGVGAGIHHNFLISKRTEPFLIDFNIPGFSFYRVTSLEQLSLGEFTGE
jgi:hypothetical protein